MSELDEVLIGLFKKQSSDISSKDKVPLTDDLKIKDDTFTLLGRYLDNKCIIDLVLSIAYYNCVVRVLGALKIDLEPEYSIYLEEFPLPVSKDK